MSIIYFITMPVGSCYRDNIYKQAFSPDLHADLHAESDTSPDSYEMREVG